MITFNRILKQGRLVFQICSEEKLAEYLGLR